MAFRDQWTRMRTDIRTAYKSGDTEEFFDKIFTKPLGYLWARFFMKIGWTPNMVTICSMVIGFCGGCLFYFESFKWNLIGVLLVIWANIYDSTDGQIARLTGNKSQLGRILDALSTSVWYVAIYLALGFRLMDDPIPFLNGPLWGGWIWPLIVVSAFAGHQVQCMMADYFPNIHLFFLKNRHGSELDRSSDLARQREALPKEARFNRFWLYCYGLYTSLQESFTPMTQKLFHAIDLNGGVTEEEVRQDYLTRSRRYVQWTNILTFNTRAYTLFACLLIGIPVWYFPIELLLFGCMLLFMVNRYESIAAGVIRDHRMPGHEELKKKSPFRKVFFLIGVAGIVVMMLTTDLSQVDWHGTVLQKLPYWLPCLLGIWALIYMIHTLVYRIIIGPDAKKLGIFKLMKVVISGFALNHVTPVGLAGGEPYRILEMKAHIGVEKATASTLTFTVMYTFSHVMLWLTGSIAYFVQGRPGRILATTLFALVGICCLALCVVFLRSGKHALVRSAIRLCSRLPIIGKRASAFLEKNRESIDTIDDEMMQFHRRASGYWSAAALEYGCRLLEVAEYWVIFRILNVKVPFAYCTIALCSASLLGNILFIVPMQVGSREGGLAISLRWFGLSSSFSVTASLMSRIRELIYLVIGVVAILVEGRKVGDVKDSDVLGTAGQLAQARTRASEEGANE